MKSFFSHNPNYGSNETKVFIPIDLSSAKLVNTTNDVITYIDAQMPGTLQKLPSNITRLYPKAALCICASTWARGLLNAFCGNVRTSGVTNPQKDIFHCWVGAHDPQFSTTVLTFSLKYILHLFKNNLKTDTFPINDIQYIKKHSGRVHPSHHISIMMRAADELGINYFPYTQCKSYWQFGIGNNRNVYIRTLSEKENVISRQILANKATTNLFLESLGYPVPPHTLINDVTQLDNAIKKINFPLVIKPVDSAKGSGVTVDIHSQAEANRAFSFAKRYSKTVMVERYIPGSDYRLTLHNGKLISCVNRQPLAVVGNGKDNIQVLLEKLNQKRFADPILRKYAATVSFEEEGIKNYLMSQSKDLAYVPAANEKVLLRSNANISSGGFAFDCTADVHPQVQSLMEEVAKQLDCHLLGIDYISKDISQTPKASGGYIIELNMHPGFDAVVLSGIEELTLGKKVLDNIKRTPNVLCVMDNENQSLIHANVINDLYDNVVGLAVMDDQSSYIDGNKLPDVHPNNRYRQILSHPNNHACLFVLSSKWVTTYGLPLQFLDLIIMDEAKQRNSNLYLHNFTYKLVNITHEKMRSSQYNTLVSEVLNAQVPDTKNNDSKVCIVHCSDEISGIKTIQDNRQLISDDVSLFVMNFNEMHLLPHFLAHYRSMGITHFTVYDDHSTDGSLEYLMQQTDCTVITSDYKYSHVHSDGMAFHHKLKNYFISTTQSKWSLIVDMDEFLYIPSKYNQDLSEYLNSIEDNGDLQIHAAMVDMYPEHLSDLNDCDYNAAPISTSPYFDRYPGFYKELTTGKFYKLHNGIRARLANRLKVTKPDIYTSIFENKNYKIAALYKTPLIRTNKNIQLLNAHSTNLFSNMNTQLVLAHHQFTANFQTMVDLHVGSEKQYKGSIEYKFLKAASENFSTIDLKDDSTVKFEDVTSFEQCGLLY